MKHELLCIRLILNHLIIFFVVLLRSIAQTGYILIRYCKFVIGLTKYRRAARKILKSNNILTYRYFISFHVCIVIFIHLTTGIHFLDGIYTKPHFLTSTTFNIFSPHSWSFNCFPGLFQ